MPQRVFCIGLVLLLACSTNCVLADETAIQLRPGFQVELVASEPLIESPVAFDWSADGKLWVVEMRDYPLGLDNKGKPGGRIVYLEDTDKDGRYDRSTVFLDELLFPTGVLTWRKGVLVTCAPDIFYAEDTDDDGRADKREVLFTGFGEANPQHRLNGLRCGLDNWIYCANGDFAIARDFGAVSPQEEHGAGFSSTQSEDVRRLAVAGAGIKSLKTGATFNIRNRDFRIQPDEGLLDPQSGQAQFGRDRDDGGEWFGCNNALPLWHFALDDAYLRRNPHVNYPSARVDVPRVPVYSIGNATRETGSPRSNGGNAFTAACSVAFYRDDLFGPEFTHNWFVCEPVYNLVHREVLVPQGTTFASRRPADETDKEFLASTDPMFSPVMVRTGPDGALWVADMYRQSLEHPHWMPAGWETRIDVRAGEKQGRIYRIYPDNAKPRAWSRLDKMTGPQLVDVLDSPNGWLRDKAQQLLVERQDRSVIGLLERQAIESQIALGRLHSLCTLDGLHALRPKLLIQTLSDAHAGVRRHSVRLSESKVVQSAAVEKALIKRVSDPDPVVRLQLAYSLGNWTTPACATALGQLLAENASDQYIAAAALSSLTPTNLAAVVQVLEGRLAQIPSAVTLGLLRSAQGFANWDATARLLDEFIRPIEGRYGSAQFTAMASWLDALEQSNTSLSQLAEQSEHAVRQIGPIFEAARNVAADSQASMSDRATAIRLLGRGLSKQQEDLAVLAEFLLPQFPDELQSAAVAAFEHSNHPDVPRHLLSSWKSYSPNLRLQVLDVLLSRAEGPQSILKALGDKEILPQDVSLISRQRLIEHPAAEVRGEANRFFSERVDSDRNKVVTAYEPALNLRGDASHGLQLFAKHCAACHRLGMVGTTIGADLAMVRDKPPEWFLPALFDPSRAVDARFINYLVVTNDGKVISGVLAEESGTNLTLIGTTGQRQVISRASIDQLTSTGKSLMPDGLEGQLKLQDVADIIAHLKRTSAPKVVDHDQPALIRPESDGSLSLLATNCEIFGNEIKIYDKYMCLGWWTSLEDKATWTVELPKAGRYAVLLTSSCDDQSAGSDFVLESSEATLNFKTASSGGWETHEQQKIGEVQLAEGISQVTVRATQKNPSATYLIDLKSVRLELLNDSK